MAFGLGFKDAQVRQLGNGRGLQDSAQAKAQRRTEQC